MCEQSPPFMSGYSNRCKNQAAGYMPSERLGQNHAGCIAITANKCKREGKPHVRPAGVRGHVAYLCLGVEALCLTFCWARRKVLEHLRNTLVQVLFIFLSFVGQSVLSAAAPNQLLVFCIVQVNNEGSFFVVLLRGGRFAHPSESSPAPSSTKAVIERLKCSLGLSRLNRHDRHIAAAVHLSPALGRQLGIHRILDSRIPEGIPWLNFLPGIGFVVSEIK